MRKIQITSTKIQTKLNDQNLKGLDSLFVSFIF
ncbi:hypothetical protein SAMN05421753_106201 [Planctomicrobium piriforme]|uniref:Uncharacterized protein n=1 Tax=Planctomicrobium piriforme TaxID=1576369 RepID=A0A1I3G5U6_9PLAN|nr:hypothetical protein SAMN05421753_106201 [Planctomicrobium piriforme]